MVIAKKWSIIQSEEKYCTEISFTVVQNTANSVDPVRIDLPCIVPSLGEWRPSWFNFYHLAM